MGNHCYFYQRMFRYFSRLYEKHNLPVYPIALFSASIFRQEQIWWLGCKEFQDED
jgi:hypothetical protein